MYIERNGLRLWTWPSVQTLAWSHINPAMTVNGERTPSEKGAYADSLTEFAARLCYMSHGSGRESSKHIENLLASGHGSTMEHASFSLLLEGVSRSLTHELVRHRAGMAYSQLSQRYVGSEHLAFVVPPDLPVTYQEKWDAHLMDALANYNQMLDYISRAEAFVGPDGVALMPGTARTKAINGLARCLLPNCTETKIVATGNVRAWRNLLQQRGSVHAESEIRRLACVILETLKVSAPLCFMDMEVTPERTITSKYTKV